MSATKFEKSLSSEESDWEIKSSSDSSNEENEEIPHQTIVLKTGPSKNKLVTNHVEEQIKSEIIDDKKAEPDDKVEDKSSVTKIDTSPNIEVQISQSADTKKIKKIKKKSESGNTSSASVDKDFEDQKIKLENIKPKKKLRSSDLTKKLSDDAENVPSKKTIKKVKKVPVDVFEKERSVNSISSDNIKIPESADPKVKIIKKKIDKNKEKTSDSLADDQSKIKSTKKNELANAESNEKKKTKVNEKKSKKILKASEETEENVKITKNPIKNKDAENTELKKFECKTTEDVEEIKPEQNVNDEVISETLNTIEIAHDKDECLNEETLNFDRKLVQSDVLSDPLNFVDGHGNGVSKYNPLKNEAICDDQKQLNFKDANHFSSQDTNNHIKENVINSEKFNGNESSNNLSSDIETNLDQWMKDLLSRHNIKREDLQTIETPLPNDNVDSKSLNSYNSELDSSFKMDNDLKKLKINAFNNEISLSSSKKDDNFMSNSENYSEDIDMPIYKKINLNKDHYDDDNELIKKPNESEIKTQKTEQKSFKGNDYENSDEEIEAVSRYLAKRYDNKIDIDDDHEKYEKKSKRQNDRNECKYKDMIHNENEDSNLMTTDKISDKIILNKRDKEFYDNDNEESFMTRFRREKYSKVSSRQNNLFQPRRREDTEEKVKEKTRPVKALIDKQQSVVDTLKNSSKKLSELESLIKEAKSESLDQKAVFENLEFALDSAYKQYENELKEAIDQINQPKKTKNDNLKEEINTILNNISYLNYNQSSKFEDNYIMRKAFEHNKLPKNYFDEMDYVRSKPTSIETFDFVSPKNRISKNILSNDEDKITFRFTKQIFRNNFEGTETNSVKSNDRKNQVEDDQSAISMSADDFINKIRTKYAIQPSTLQWKCKNNSNNWNSPSSRSSISDFTTFENKYGKLATGNQYNLNKFTNERHSLTKCYDDSSDTMKKYVSIPKKYVNDEGNFKNVENTFESSGLREFIPNKYEKNFIPLFQSKFLKSVQTSDLYH